MLGQRRRRWPNINPAPGQRVLFARFLFVAEKLGSSRPTTAIRVWSRRRTHLDIEWPLHYHWLRGNVMIILVNKKVYYHFHSN